MGILELIYDYDSGKKWQILKYNIRNENIILNIIFHFFSLNYQQIIFYDKFFNAEINDKKVISKLFFVVFE